MNKGHSSGAVGPGKGFGGPGYIFEGDDNLLALSIREEVRKADIIGWLDVAWTFVRFSYFIVDLIDKNQNLNEEIDCTKKVLNEALDSHKKRESTYIA
ncbi:hypothetical protein FNV43_RR24584 [Rhamnella rubrinervis]|uniref:Uncharacterized protein n=1 Tax=Rhamnella rubrinervis TaxID=2594499 RepID=A0A8K0GLC6_9ROSA|nr:hypothetical protein FNV43_RR24584 [Rhamnella rubrinervis]